MVVGFFPYTFSSLGEGYRGDRVGINQDWDFPKQIYERERAHGNNYNDQLWNLSWVRGMRQFEGDNTH